MGDTTQIGFPIRYPTPCQWGRQGAVSTPDDLLPCLAPAERRVTVGVLAVQKSRSLDLCSKHLRVMLDNAEASGAVVQ